MHWSADQVRAGIAVVLALISLVGAYLLKRYIAQRVAHLEAKHFITPVNLPNADLGVVHVRTGHFVAEPYIVELRLQNRGPGGLKSVDMTGGNLRVDLGPACRVVALAGVWVDGKGLYYNSGFPGQRWIDFPPMNLKKGSRGSVRLICTGRPEIDWVENLPDASLREVRDGTPRTVRPIPGPAAGAAAVVGGVTSWHFATRPHDALVIGWVTLALCIYATFQCFRYWWRN